jgi:predicted SAM-dependent methyltransferase
MGGSSGRPDVVLHIPDGLWQLEPAAYEQVYWGHGPEHIFPDKLREALHDLHRILVPGGRLTLATISLEGIFHNAFEQGYSREAVNAYLYGDAKSTDHPLQAHRQVFTEAWLTESLKAAGFAIVRPWALAEYPELQSLGDCASSSYHVTLYLEGIKAP